MYYLSPTLGTILSSLESAQPPPTGTLVMIKAAGAHPAAVHADKKPVSAIAAIIVHTICIIPRARIAFIRLRYQNAFGVGIAVADMDSSHGVIHGSAVRGLALQLQVHAPASTGTVRVEPRPQHATKSCKTRKQKL